MISQKYVTVSNGNESKMYLYAHDAKVYTKIKKELSYRQQIARKLRTRYAEGIYGHKYYTVTLKSRLSVTQSQWKKRQLDRSYTT